jgi:hypothetical protein
MSLPSPHEPPAHYQIIPDRIQSAPTQNACTGASPDPQETVRHFTVDEWEAGRKYHTRSGVRVRSKIEKIIADFFFIEGIPFVYEPSLRIGGVNYRPDFYLPAYDLYYEHFGVTEAAYQTAAQSKIARYLHDDLRFIYTTVEDEPDIEDAIVDQLAVATLDG